jgi:hypothetical protein
MLGNGIEVVIVDLELVAVDLGHGRRWNVLAIGTVEVAVERRFIEITVLRLVQHRLALVYRSRCAAHVVVVVGLESALAVFWHKLDAFLVHVVVAIIALHALLEQSAQELLAILAHSGSRVSVNLECVWDFHSRYRTRAASVRR